MMNKRCHLNKIVGFSGARFTTGLLLAVMLGLVMPCLLPAPVQAQPPDPWLELGGEGATSWTIENILPCDSGVKTVTLHNASDLNSFVTIWISGIDSGEGKNPEPETNKEGEGELDDYLLFDLSTSPSGRLDTNISLPTTINNFPQSYGDPNYILITPLGAGETVTLYWEWELPCATGNDAQGDTLSFDINYTIEDFETQTTVTTTTTRTCECEINILNDEYGVRIDCCNNTVTGTQVFFDPDNVHFLEIERGTALICGDCLECGDYPRWIVMNVLDDPPPAPEWLVQLGPAYELIGYHDEDMENPCPTVMFSKPVVLLLNYDHYEPVELPEEFSAVVIAYYDTELGVWVELPQDEDTGRIAEFGEISAVLNHLSTFAVFAKLSSPSAPPEPSSPQPTVTPPSSPPSPANFVVSSLQVVPSRQVTSLGRPFAFMVRMGENVTISANVANNGGQGGSYVADLMINGQSRGTKEVTLLPGQSQELVFDVSDNEPGSHTLRIGGLAGEFQTGVWVNWWLIAGIATAFGLLTWLAWYYGYRRGRR